MRIFFVLSIALVAGSVLLAQTNTQTAIAESSALSGVSTNGLTDIKSDGGGEFYYKIKTYIYRQNVRVDNPQMKLRCELLTVESPEVKWGKFDRATAETNVVIDWVDDTGTNHATAAKAVYTKIITNTAVPPEQKFETNALVVLTGNPVVTTGRGIYTGDEIVWDRVRDVIKSSGWVDTKIFADRTNSSILDMPNSKPNPK